MANKRLRRICLLFGLSSALLSLAALAAPQAQFLTFSDDYIEITDSDALDLTGGSFTLSAWIKPAGWGQNDQGRILDHGGGSSGGTGWSLHLENQSSGGFPQALRFQVNSDSSYSDMSNTGVITLNVWQHVAVTYDSGTLTFYVNAIEAGTSLNVPVPLARDEIVRIGARAADESRFFDGGVDEVRIWDRALGSQELMDLMDQELTGSEPGLVAYYSFNEGSGQTTADGSGNGHDGQLGSAVTTDDQDPEWATEPANEAPLVDAGVNQVMILSAGPASLGGSASDDGLPAATLFTSWTVVSGPDVVNFSDASDPAATVTFGSPGTYILRLTADDTLLSSSDDVTIQVDLTAQLTSIEITPDSVSLLVGVTQAFIAQGIDQTGASIAITPGWSATGGFIDAQSGLYTAGGSIGQFSVTASDGAVSGSADVFISDFLVPWPTAGWPTANPQDLGIDPTLLEQARDYALSGGGSGYITRHGYLVMSWGSDSERYAINSSTKSIGSLILGLAVDDGLLQTSDLAQLYLPSIGVPPESNAATGWLENMSILNLATQTAGFDKSGGFIDLLFQPGTTWAYSDGGMNWLADVLTNIYAEDIKILAFNRIFSLLGITSTDLIWRKSNRPDFPDGIKRREFGSGISSNVDAMARIGYMMLRGGQWHDISLIPDSFVDQVRSPVPGVLGLPIGNDTKSRFDGASDHYGIMWWNNADGSIAWLPTDAYWSWGLKDSLIVVIPSLDMVISRAGNGWAGNRSPSYYNVLEPFLAPIAQAALLGPQNQAPEVSAGTDQQITLPTDTVNLAGSVNDDGLPGGNLVTAWSQVAGPGTVTFGDSTILTTTAQFSTDGVYVLQLMADDSDLMATDEVTITVSPVADADGDGLSDDDEVNIYLTDPDNPDTDGDGLSDGDEVNTYGTDSILRDTDGDGFGDGVEISEGTDPNNTAGPYPPPDGDLAPRSVYDGILNVGDYLVAQRMVLGLETPTVLDIAHGDLNASGSIDTPDLLLILQQVLPPEP